MRLYIIVCLLAVAAAKESLVKKNEDKAKELIMLEIEPIFHDNSDPRSGQGKRAARPGTRAVFGTSPGQYLLKGEDASVQAAAPEVPAEYLGLLQELVAQQQQAAGEAAKSLPAQPVIQQLVVERDPQPVVSRFTTTVDEAQLLTAQRQAAGRRQPSPAGRQQQILQQAYYDQRQQAQPRISTPAPAPQTLAPQFALPQSQAHAIHEARLRASLAGQNPNLAAQQLAAQQQATQQLAAQQQATQQFAAQQQLLAQQEQQRLLSQQEQQRHPLLVQQQQQILAEQQQQQLLAQQQQQHIIAQQQTPRQLLRPQNIAATTASPSREEALFQRQLARLAAQAQAEEQQLAQISALSQAHEELQLTKQQLSALTQAQERQLQQRLNSQQQLQLQQALQEQQPELRLQQQLQQQHDITQQIIQTQSGEPQNFPPAPPPDTRPTSIGQQQQQYITRAQNAHLQLPQLQQGIEYGTVAPQLVRQPTQSPLALQSSRRVPASEQYLRETSVQDRPRGRRPQQQIARPTASPQPSFIDENGQSQDDEIISSLLGQSNRGLFSSGKTSAADALNIIQHTTAQPPSSRSSIFVSSTIKSPQSSRFTIEDAVERVPNDKPVPIVRLPTPEGQRPLTQSEFQSLVDAGFKIAPVAPQQEIVQSVQVAPAAQLYSVSPKRQRSYSTPSPPQRNNVVHGVSYQKEEEADYKTSVEIPPQRIRQQPPQSNLRLQPIVVPEEPEVVTRLAPIYVPDLPDEDPSATESQRPRRPQSNRRPNQYRQRTRGSYRPQATTESEYEAYDSVPQSTSQYATRTYRQRSRRPTPSYEQ